MGINLTGKITFDAKANAILDNLHVSKSESLISKSDYSKGMDFIDTFFRSIT